ncbi:MAG: polyprenyl synthetase family protein [Solirubrobacteraceae bacterium]|nr:polyprenyl synthetase family protein [Solirubrobacteraceae bacterium]MDP4673715.1 polyprenyl synthetase family protein [Solirubrobacteraceae bacterium]
MSYPDDLRDQVDEYLRQLRFSDGPATEGLEEAMLYSLLAGGKRIRPVLALATAAALGDEPESVMPLAGALEMVHSYSLIHDDLPAMDDDDLRRGKPSCHVAFGEDVAILAGDALYAEAFKLILSEQPGDPSRLLKASAELASATGVNGMVGGQYLDVEGAAADGADGLRELHARKTGRLIGASVECVCLLHGVDEATLLAYRAFATELGVLFQIVDDILDVTGSDEALGKPSGSDERQGKRTYVSEFGLAQAGALADASHQQTRAALAAAAPKGADQLERITDFIAARES